MFPEDWREYQWNVFSSTSGSGAYTDPLQRLWRVHIIADGVGGGVTFGGNVSAYPVGGGTVQVLANETLVLEPKGMMLADLQWTGLAKIVIETMHRSA